jgi:hypothetical protein
LQLKGADEAWRAHIDVSALATYSWPAADLKGFKEEKMSRAIVPRLHREFDKLIKEEAPQA